MTLPHEVEARKSAFRTALKLVLRPNDMSDIAAGHDFTEIYFLTSMHLRHTVIFEFGNEAILIRLNVASSSEAYSHLIFFRSEATLAEHASGQLKCIRQSLFSVSFEYSPGPNYAMQTVFLLKMRCCGCQHLNMSGMGLMLSCFGSSCPKAITIPNSKYSANWNMRLPNCRLQNRCRGRHINGIKGQSVVSIKNPTKKSFSFTTMCRLSTNTVPSISNLHVKRICEANTFAV